MAMHLRFVSFVCLLSLLLLLSSCTSSDEFTGYSYDPEGVTNTTDKEIQDQHKRTIGISTTGVWISNEFDGARMNNFYRVKDSLYRVIIEPENHPINNSPWYSFKIHSDSPQKIRLQLAYKHGKHRYFPKLSTDGEHWSPIPLSRIEADTAAGTATLTLDLNEEPLWVSAQELLTFDDMQQWADSISTSASVAKLDTVGYSHNNRPILKISAVQNISTRNRGVLIITGRQHPPEVTGGLASQYFIETLLEESELAKNFRDKFDILIYPLVNPDGVDNGHWRHNGAGIDLNRDWEHFNQPETKAIRDDLLPLKEDPSRTVYYGIDFHSTNENIFYPINRDISTFPEDFTYGWIDTLKEAAPDTPINVEPFPPNSPIAKNWIYHTFGADAVTYEVDDAADRQNLEEITEQTAKIIMRQLLEEWDKNQE